MNIINQPLKYTPAGNPNRWTFSADSKVIFFKTLVYDEADNQLSNNNLFVSPLDITTASFDVSGIVKGLVKPEIDNQYQVPVTGKTLPLAGYYLTVTPYSAATSGLLRNIPVPMTTGTTTDLKYVIDGKLDILNYTNLWTANSHICTGTGNTANYLTYQPDYKCTNEYAAEQLWSIIDASSSAITVDYVINGSDTISVPFSGITTEFVTQVPAVPPTLGVATITITGTGQVNDNIIVYAENTTQATPQVELGRYAIVSSAQTVNSIANALYSQLNANTHGYNVQYDLANQITITAPTGTGGDLFNCRTDRYLTGTTLTAITDSISATVTLTGLTYTTDLFSTTTIQINDPDFGAIVILYSPSIIFDEVLEDYLDNLVAAINVVAVGYTATRVDQTIIISSRQNTGDFFNGVLVTYDNDTDEQPAKAFTFSGGITNSSSGTTITYNIIKHSLQNFTGSTAGEPATTNSTFEFDTNGMIRIQSSIRTLRELGYTGDIDGYSVTITDNGEPISKTFNYTYCEPECNQRLVNVLWLNSFGAIDTFQFQEPVVTTSTERNSIRRNNANLSASQVYVTRDAFNAEKYVYNDVTKSSVKLHSNWISNDTAEWLNELYKTKQCWVELNNGQLLPCQIQENSYTVQRNSYNQIAQVEFNLEFDNNIILPTAKDKIVINS
jgi:hypothetical protein